jgi:hypothetical protein
MRLPAGTILYHGTDCPDYDEEHDRLDGPAWVTSSKTVAEHFARRPGWGGTSRVITFELEESVDLPELNTRQDRDDLEEQHNIRFDSAEDMRDSVQMAGIAGWIAPANYPDGDDIMLADTSVLKYLHTEVCDELDAEAQAGKRMRP